MRLRLRMSTEAEAAEAAEAAAAQRETRQTEAVGEEKTTPTKESAVQTADADAAGHSKRAPKGGGRRRRVLERRGLAEAMYNLGLAYEWGEGVARRAPEVAVGWWRRAAAPPDAQDDDNHNYDGKGGLGGVGDNGPDRGHARSAFKLGLAYSRGEGVARCMATARRWWAEAARGGVAEAQANLGSTFNNNSKNLKLATRPSCPFWLYCAAFSGVLCALFVFIAW